MLQTLEGFQSFETQHCVTGSLRHIYEFHGYSISEEMLLGLGSGVGFLYWHQKGMDPFYGGRANFERPGEEGLEKTVGADMGFLPYLELPEDYRFGAHSVVVAGYDPESRYVLITDRDAELHPVSWEDLAKARGSKHKPFPPQHQWFSFDLSEKRPPTAEEIRQAIRDVTKGMLEPPISNFGVKGIRTAVKRTLKWPQQMDKERLRWTCFNIFIFIDYAGGTGGGIFRYMYARFLQEAADITGESSLADIGEQMHTIGDQWQEVAEIFRQAHEAPDPAALLPDATSRMKVIADQEQAAWEELTQVVGG
ncbi:MAG: hypothetical protein AMJ93_16000 [Anaerolineae bacterium SM23_84]|nr:MAG: hypothetical protein AMJ93_16000 [Anaerolineae bacterium SM23_84]